MNKYLVKYTITNGEYEYSDHFVVVAESYGLAVRAAEGLVDDDNNGEDINDFVLIHNCYQEGISKWAVVPLPLTEPVFDFLHKVMGSFVYEAGINE